MWFIVVVIAALMGMWEIPRLNKAGLGRERNVFIVFLLAVTLIVVIFELGWIEVYVTQWVELVTFPIGKPR